MEITSARSIYTHYGGEKCDDQGELSSDILI